MEENFKTALIFFIHYAIIESKEPTSSYLKPGSTPIETYSYLNDWDVVSLCRHIWQYIAIEQSEPWRLVLTYLHKPADTDSVYELLDHMFDTIDYIAHHNLSSEMICETITSEPILFKYIDDIPKFEIKSIISIF